MTKDFDAYHKWLGIPPKDQPPNHYRLLALDLFESDAEIIDTAANRQMSYLQQLAAGQHAALSQKLLNEISAARLCLLDRKKKEEYDRELRRASAAPAAEEPLAENKAFDFLAAETGAATGRRKPAASRAKASKGAKTAFTARRWMILGGSGIVAVLLGAALAWTVIAARNRSAADSAEALRLRSIAPQAVEAEKRPTATPPAALLELAPVESRKLKARESLTVTVTAKNADAWQGKKVRYSLDPQYPAGATVNAETGQFSWTPPDEAVGDYQVTVAARGPDGQAAKATFVVTVTKTPLEVAPVEAQTVEAGKPLNVPLSVKDADAWKGKVRYVLGPQHPADAVINAETGEFSWTPPADMAAGNYIVTVLAWGPDGQAARAAFIVRVTQAQPSPGSEPASPETQWVRTAKLAAAKCNGILVQDLPLTDGVARIPRESLGRLAAQKVLYVGLGKLDGAASSSWEFGQGFEQTPGESTWEINSLAKTTGHGRVDVSLEPRSDGLYLALHGLSPSDDKADKDFTQKEKAVTKAMATIRGWYTADPGPERMEVVQTLKQCGMNILAPKTFEPLPAPPPTSSINSRTSTTTSRTRAAQTQAQAATLQAYQQAYVQAVARRKNQVDRLLSNLQKRLEVLKKRVDDARKKPDPEREAADKVLATACKSISAVIYPAVVEIEGNHLYQLGEWRLYWTSDRNYVDIWYRDGSLAVEIIGNASGMWHWRDGDQEYNVFSTGSTSSTNFYLRPWEQPGAAPAVIHRSSRHGTASGANQEPPDPASASVIRSFSEFSAGRARLSCEGDRISVVFEDGNTLSIALVPPEVRYKSGRNGNSLKFSSGILALPIGAQ